MGQQRWRSQCAGARLTYVGRLKVTLAVSEEEFSAVVLVLLAGMAAPGGGGGGDSGVAGAQFLTAD